MTHSIFKTVLAGLMTCFMLGLFFSCSEESTSVDEATIENYVDQSVDYLHAEGNCGRHGCYDFVFPIILNFPDGETVTVEDYRELRAELKMWFKENGENIDWPERSDTLDYDDIPWDQLPSLGFPLEVIDEDGEIITVESREELRELRKACPRNILKLLRRHFRRHHSDICFTFIYPVSIEFADGSILTAATPRALKAAIREWRQRHPNPNNKPKLVFPVNIEFEDGSTAEIATPEALKAVKEACSD